MKNVFEATKTELAGGGDPNLVVEVQNLVRELFASDDARILGIKKQLVEDYGLAALPGIISATYTLQDYLGNENNQQLLAEIMVMLAEGNETAVELIFSQGIIENPFNSSRLVCQLALEKIGVTELQERDLRRIRQAVENAQREYDPEGAAILLETWLTLAPQDAYDSAFRTAQSWLRARTNAPQAYRLVNKCLEHFPEKAEEIFRMVISSFDRGDRAARDNIVSHVEIDSATALHVIPSVDQELRGKRGTAQPHEGLMRCLGPLLLQNPGLLEKLHSQAFHAEEKVKSFWWIAVTEAAKQGSQDLRQYLFDSALADDRSDFFDGAALQLFFLDGRKTQDKKLRDQAREYKRRLEVQNPERYQRAHDNFERIIGSNTEYDRTIFRGDKAGGITT